MVSLISQAHWAELAVALLCVIVAALLTTIEAALQSFSKSRAQALDDGSRRVARLITITEDPAPTLNTLLFLRTLLEILAIALVGLVTYDAFRDDATRLLVTVGSMVVVSFVLLGVAPRTLGRQHADRVALSWSWLLAALTTVLGPVAQLMIIVGNVVTPGRGFVDGPFASEAELRELVDIAEASEVIEEGERRMIHSVFELGDTLVREVMVPRPDVVFIEDHKTLRQAMSLSLRSGFSRIPVIGEGGLDDVVGILYLKDIIKRVYDNAGAQSSERVASMMRQPTYCPDSKPVDELLAEMQRSHSHLVIVVDEFGGTAGLATIEDILEEIVGEIVDEYDQEPEPFTELGPGYFRVSSRLNLEDLGELFGLRLADDQVETVGGIMAKMLDKVPIPGSMVRWESLEFIADRSTGRRNQIGTVLVRLITDDDRLEDDKAVDAAADFARTSAELDGRHAPVLPPPPITSPASAPASPPSPRSRSRARKTPEGPAE